MLGGWLGLPTLKFVDTDKKGAGIEVPTAAEGFGYSSGVLAAQAPQAALEERRIRHSRLHQMHFSKQEGVKLGHSVSDRVYLAQNFAQSVPS